MAGITSPAREWFRLTTPDEELADEGDVKNYLYVSMKRMLSALARGFVYKDLHTLYGDMGDFGVGVVFIDSDPVDLIRSYSIPIGEFYLAQGPNGRVDTLFRETSLTVGQLVKKFGIEACSNRVRDLHGQNLLDENIPVIHVVMPREDYDPDKADSLNMPWASCWFEVGATEMGLLGESGYNECPFIAPRWNTTGNDVYGTGPGHAAIGDAMTLQLKERKKNQGIERIVDPPLIGPKPPTGKAISMMPGALNFSEGPATGKQFEPLVVVPPEAISVIDNSIRQDEQRIDTVYFANLFLMLSQEQEGGQPITAREVAERAQEKLLQLGPVMERLEGEALNPLVERIYGILNRAGRLPPAPAVLQGANLLVEYLSIMAQAQKAVGMGAIQQFAAFVQNVAEAKPEVLDNVDTDQMVADVADMLSVNPRIIVAADKVAKLRAARARQQQAQAASEQAMAGAVAAKNLAGADMSGDNALTRLGGVPAAQAGSVQ